MSEPFGHPLHRFDSVGSTNDEAARLARAGASEGTVVVARTQTAGRGRQERRWESPPGGLWMSLVLRPPVSPAALPGLTLVMAAAVARALQATCGLDATVRWPNDVYVGDRKIAGLLSEARCSGDTVEACCIGLGLNVNVDVAALPDDVRATATSLLALRGQPTDEDDVRTAVLGAMEEDYRRFREGGFEALRASVAQRCATLGRRVEVLRDQAPAVSGVARALGSQGSLRVSCASGTEEIWTCERIRLLDDGYRSFEPGTMAET